MPLQIGRRFDQRPAHAIPWRILQKPRQRYAIYPVAIAIIAAALATVAAYKAGAPHQRRKSYKRAMAFIIDGDSEYGNQVQALTIFFKGNQRTRAEPGHTLPGGEIEACDERNAAAKQIPIPVAAAIREAREEAGIELITYPFTEEPVEEKLAARVYRYPENLVLNKNGDNEVQVVYFIGFGIASKFGENKMMKHRNGLDRWKFDEELSRFRNLCWPHIDLVESELKFGVADAWKHAVRSPELKAWIEEMRMRNVENAKPTRKKPRQDDKSPAERKRQKQLEELDEQLQQRAAEEKQRAEQQRTDEEQREEQRRRVRKTFGKEGSSGKRDGSARKKSTKRQDPPDRDFHPEFIQTWVKQGNFRPLTEQLKIATGVEGNQIIDEFGDYMQDHPDGAWVKEVMDDFIDKPLDAAIERLDRIFEAWIVDKYPILGAGDQPQEVADQERFIEEDEPPQEDSSTIEPDTPLERPGRRARRVVMSMSGADMRPLAQFTPSTTRSSRPLTGSSRRGEPRSGQVSETPARQIIFAPETQEEDDIDLERGDRGGDGTSPTQVIRQNQEADDENRSDEEEQQELYSYRGELYTYAQLIELWEIAHENRNRNDERALGRIIRRAEGIARSDERRYALAAAAGSALTILIAGGSSEQKLFAQEPKEEHHGRIVWAIVLAGILLYLWIMLLAMKGGRGRRMTLQWDDAPPGQPQAGGQAQQPSAWANLRKGQQSDADNAKGSKGQAKGKDGDKGKGGGKAKGKDKSQGKGKRPKPPPPKPPIAVEIIQKFYLQDGNEAREMVTQTTPLKSFPDKPTVVYIPSEYAETHGAALLDAIASSATPWAMIIENDVIPDEDLERQVRDMTVRLEKSTPTIRLIESFEDKPSEQRNVVVTLISQAQHSITKYSTSSTTVLPPRDLLPVVALWLFPSQELEKKLKEHGNTCPLWTPSGAALGISDERSRYSLPDGEQPRGTQIMKAVKHGVAWEASITQRALQELIPKSGPRIIILLNAPANEAIAIPSQFRHSTLWWPGAKLTEENLDTAASRKEEFLKPAGIDRGLVTGNNGIGYRIQEEHKHQAASLLGLAHTLKENRWVLEGATGQRDLEDILSVMRDEGWQVHPIKDEAGQYTTAEGRLPLVFALQPPPENPPFIKLSAESEVAEEYVFDSSDEVIHIMRSSDHSRDRRSKRNARRASYQDDSGQSGYAAKTESLVTIKQNSEMQALRSDLHTLRSEIQGLKQGAIAVATEQQRQAEVQAAIQSQVVATHRHQLDLAAYQQQNLDQKIQNSMLTALAQFHGKEPPQLPSIPDIPQPAPLVPMLAVEGERSSKTRKLPSGGTPAERRYAKKQDTSDDDEDARSMPGVNFHDARSDEAAGGGK